MYLPNPNRPYTLPSGDPSSQTPPSSEGAPAAPLPLLQAEWVDEDPEESLRAQSRDHIRDAYSAAHQLPPGATPRAGNIDTERSRPGTFQPNAPALVSPYGRRDWEPGSAHATPQRQLPSAPPSPPRLEPWQRFQTAPPMALRGGPNPAQAYPAGSWRSVPAQAAQAAQAPQPWASRSLEGQPVTAPSAAGAPVHLTPRPVAHPYYGSGFGSAAPVQPPTAAPWAWQNPGIEPVGHPVQSTPAQQASWGGNGQMSSPNNGPAPINIVVQNTNTVASSQPAPPASAPSAVPNATLARPLEPPVGPATLVRVGGRSRSTAIFLSLALGWMGAHRFYLGHSRSGILYLIFCWTYIPLVLSVLSAFKIMGMSREEFDRVYNFAPGWNPTPV